MSLKDEALNYHKHLRPGKIEIASINQCDTAYDLSLAYSPGVAEPVRAIQNNKDNAYRYNNKGICCRKHSLGCFKGILWKIEIQKI